jgi:hypothetical protein
MMAVGRPWSLEATGGLNKLPHIRHTMTMQHDTTMGSAQNRILDAAEVSFESGTFPLAQPLG